MERALGDAEAVAAEGSAAEVTGAAEAAATEAAGAVGAAMPIATEGEAPSAAPRFGKDAASRAHRKRLRERGNAMRDRQMVAGIAATLAGGIFWGFSGTCASFLFDNYAVDTLWLMCARQLCSGFLFLFPIFARDRARFVELFTTPHDLMVFLAFTAGGVILNQFGYLLAVRLMNAGTATVLQCLQLVFIMVYACITSRRAPRRRELAGVVLALAGTYLISTGGNPSTLTIPLDGLIIGLIAAVGAACMSVIPVKLLPKYGSSVITGSGMLVSGIVSSLFIQPWAHMPAFDAMGWGAFAVLAFVGSFLAYFLYMQGVKDIGSMRASLIGTVEPVSATITSALFLGTFFAGTDIVGFALIIIMVFLTV